MTKTSQITIHFLIRRDEVLNKLGQSPARFGSCSCLHGRLIVQKAAQFRTGPLQCLRDVSRINIFVESVGLYYIDISTPFLWTLWRS